MYQLGLEKGESTRKWGREGGENTNSDSINDDSSFADTVLVSWHIERELSGSLSLLDLGTPH